MTISVLDKYKKYKEGQSLLTRAEKIFTSSSAYDRFEERLIEAYNTDSSLDVFGTVLDETSKITSATYSNSLKNEILLKIASSNTTNKSIETIHQSEKLIKEAQDVLPTSASFHNFEDKLEQSYTENATTENLEYTINTLVSIDEAKSSPIYQQELNNITNDSQFSSFVEITSELDVPYTTETYFTPTQQISQAISEELPSDSILMFESVNTTMNLEEAKDMLKPTNKTVLHSNMGGVSNAEDLITGDGILNKDSVSTDKIENERLEKFESNFNSAISSEAVQSAIDSYNNVSENSITLSTNSDIATTTDINDNSQDVSKEAMQNLDALYSDTIRKILYGGQQDPSATQPSVAEPAIEQ